MIKINKKVENIAPSGIREFFDLVIGMEGVISLGVGEPDFTTPWNICEYSIFSLEKGYTSYTSNKGLLELRVEISEFLNNSYGLQYNPDKEILITSGVSQGLDLVIRALIEPGDKVLIPTPSYVSYQPLTELAGGIPVLLNTKSDKEFKFTSTQLEKICKREKNIKAFIFNYPSNPTGVSYNEEELKSIAKIVEKYNIVVISDEIYDRLSYKFKHVPFPFIKNMKDRTVYLNGFSKAYAMTGWRVGYACGPEKVISAMTKIHQYNMLCAPIMSQLAAVEALKHSKSSVEYMVKEYTKRKNFLVKRFNEMGLKCQEPYGSFYLYPDISGSYNNSVDFAKDLVKEQKVAVIPGIAFGGIEGDKFVRVSYASNLKKLKEATNRIQKFLSSIS